MKAGAILFGDGQSAFFKNGEQVPEAQVSWLLLYVKHLESIGIDPIDVEIGLPNGRNARIFKIEGGYNWEVI